MRSLDQHRARLSYVNTEASCLREARENIARQRPYLPDFHALYAQSSEEGAWA